MRSALYTAGVPGRSAALVFSRETRPTAAPLPLGRAQTVVTPQAQGDSTSDNNRQGKTSDDSRETKARGSLRGRREQVILNTKPPNLPTKMGSTGTKISMTANYFLVNRKSDWTLYQYRVDFEPEIHLVSMRKALTYGVLPQDVGMLFDGTVLFTIEKLGGHEPTFQKTARSREGTEYLVKFKFTKTVSTMDVASLQVYNLVLRLAMKGLQLQMVGRNYFDADASVSQFNSILIKLSDVMRRKSYCVFFFASFFVVTTLEKNPRIQSGALARLYHIDSSTRIRIAGVR